MNCNVAIDTGKFNTKGFTVIDGKAKRIIFRTKATRTDESVSGDSESFVIETPNSTNPTLSKVIMGRKAKDEDMDFETEKKKDLHKIAVHTALANLVPSKSVIENFAIGYPINLFNNVEARNEFAEFIKGDGKVKVKVNSVDFECTIKNVYVLPEASGIILQDIAEYEDEVVAVFDWGGLNVNGCIFKYGNPVDGTYFTINKGVNVLKSELKSELNKKFVSNIQDYMMDDILRIGYIKKAPEESKKFISDFIHEYIKHIKGEAERAQWDFENLLKLHSIGGGSIQFAKQLKEAFEDILISDNAVWDNVEGYYAVISE